MTFFSYFDKGFLYNPITEYFQWLFYKVKFQLANWGKHLRIGYLSRLYKTKVGKYNLIDRNSRIINSELGDFTYVAANCVIANTIIGKFCSIGPNVIMSPGKHPTSGFVSTHPSTYSNPSNLIKNFVEQSFFVYDQSISIGNDVWIGCNVTIIDGVKIHDGAVVAANSVVTKDVEAYSIVGGIPAKHIKNRFDDSQIDFLINYKWWDKSEDFIKNNIELWQNIDQFTLKFKTQNGKN